MATAATYEVIGVRASHRTVTRTRQGAPPESWLVQWGKNNGSDFVIRYFPSRKGWRILDIRKAITVTSAGGARRAMYAGQLRGSIYYPNKDAAIMAAIHLLG